MNIYIDGTKVPLELLESQNYRNMEVIPIRMKWSGNQEFLTLKRGLDAGAVEISECEVSTVGTVLARNNANIPLLLIDGDEILGAKQNRIMNRSLLIPPKTTLAISVSCTERGRGHYESSRNDIHNDFEDRESFDSKKDIGLCFNSSRHAADFATRSVKSRALFEDMDCQNAVWESIDRLENITSFKSRTSALNDNYEHLKPRHDEYLRHFKIEYGQVGAVFIINGQIKGLELFHSPSVYHDYHEKIFKSYIMEAITKGSGYSRHYASRYDVERFLNGIGRSDFRDSKGEGLGRHIRFANRYGAGAALLNNGELIHMAYFNSTKSEISSRGRSRRYGSFREFSDSY